MVEAQLPLLCVQCPAYFKKKKITDSPRTLWDTYQTTHAASRFFPRRATFSTGTREQKRSAAAAIHNPAKTPQRPRGTMPLLADTCWSRGTGPSNWSSVDGPAAKALMGSLLKGESKNFKLMISNIIVVDELVNSKKKRWFYMYDIKKKKLCKVRKCNNLKRSYLCIYKL